MALTVTPRSMSLQSQILTPHPRWPSSQEQGQLTLAELTVVEVPWLPVEEPVSLQETME